MICETSELFSWVGENDKWLTFDDQFLSNTKFGNIFMFMKIAISLKLDACTEYNRVTSWSTKTIDAN